MKKILCVEDSPEILKVVEAALKPYQVVRAMTLAEARARLKGETFALILLDIQLPDGDGLDFFARFRGEPRLSRVPVIMLTTQAEVESKVKAFSLGVDDFVPKPFSSVELRARVAAKIRRMEELSAQPDDEIHIGALALSLTKQRAWCVEDSRLTELTLTAIEFRLLSCLVAHPERGFDRRALLEFVWGENTHVLDRTVDVHVSHLRKKIRACGLTLDHVAHEGYRLRVAKDLKLAG